VKSHAPRAHRWILLAAFGSATAIVPGAARTADAQGADPKGANAKGATNGADANGESADGAPIDPPATDAPAPGPATDTPPSVDAPIKPAPDAAPKFTFEPFGFLRLQYRVVQNDPFVEFVGRDDGFELQNARFGVRGALANKKLSYKLSIDGAVDERSHVNVPDGKLRVGLRDAYADVVVSGPVALRAGYFETLVDPDLDDDTQREFVDRPLESRGVRPTQGYQTPGLPPGRSLGAAIRLEPEEPASGAKIGFEIAVQNGADEFASDNDNDVPALSASVLARLPNRTWLVASGRWNRRTDGELPLQRDEDDFQGSAGARIAAGPVAFGAGGVVQRTRFPTTGGPDRNAYGAHAMVLFTVPGTLPIGVGYRFGILDPSSLILTDRVMEHSAGAVLSVPSLRLRLQLQLTYVMEQGARDLANNRAQLAAEISL
jgi:hypothetical protein